MNEVAARVVAGRRRAHVRRSPSALGQPWLLVPLAYGFWARVLTGPDVEPARPAGHPRGRPPAAAAPRLVAGPPKRFAQAIGVVFSSAAVVLWFGFGAHGGRVVVVGVLAVAALLESAFGICLGCRVFAVLMRVGLIPDEVCAACADITLRHPRAHGAAAGGG